MSGESSRQGAPSQDGKGTSDSAPDVQQDAAGNGAAQAPEWFRTFAEKVEGRIGDLGRDLGKLRQRVKRDPETTEDPAKPKNTPAAATADDLDAAMRLGELRAQLPEEARSYLDERRSNGASYAEIADLAETIIKFGAPANGAQSAGAMPAPRGHGASPAESTPVLPTSQAEFVELQKTDPAKAKVVAEHPDFDFWRLPLK